MQMKKCEQGHYFDGEKHNCCPYCGSMGESSGSQLYPDHYKADAAPDGKKTEPLYRPEPPVCIYAGPPLPEQPAPKKKDGFWGRFRTKK